MDVFNLLSYINKVSLLAFFITTLVVGYQVYLLKKEKTKEQTPSIPDFKEKNNFNVIANFTSLPSSLTKKELKTVNYSKLIFLIIFLLTIMVVIIVFISIKQNGSVRNEASVIPTIVVLPTPTFKSTCTGQACLTPTKTPTIKPIVALSPLPTVTPSPTISLSPSPTVVLLQTSLAPGLSPTVTLLQTSLNPTISPTIIPTEIILAQAPSSTPILNSTNGQKITDSVPKVLPETGSWGKGLLIIGVAISTIFFSFWF